MDHLSKEELIKRRVKMIEEKEKSQAIVWQLMGAIAMLDSLIDPEEKDKNGESNLS